MVDLFVLTSLDQLLFIESIFYLLLQHKLSFCRLSSYCQSIDKFFLQGILKG